MDKFDPNRIADRLEAARGEDAKRALVAEVIAAAHAMLDADLLAEHERTSGKPGSAAADALPAEIEQRGLNT